MREPVLIFDFGNVVGFFDYLRVCEHFAAPAGISAPALRDRLLERGFADLLVEFETGRIEPESFAAQMMELAELDLSLDDFTRGWRDMFWPNEQVVDLISHLKSRGYRLFLGSNTNVLHATHYRRQFAATFDGFEGYILSYEVGHMKPAREFFDACVRAAGVPASSCVFIDDVEANVEGARSAGLVGIHYVESTALVAELARLGIEVSPPSA